MRGARPTATAIDGALVKVPLFPKTLDQSVKAEWRDIAADLVGRGLLTKSQVPVLEALVGAIWMSRECRQAIVEHGPLIRSKEGVIRPNPAAAMLAKANEIVARLSYELGISAAGRNLNSIKAQADAAQEDDATLLGF